MNDIKTRVHNVFKETLDTVPEGHITTVADSLDCVELVMAIEEEFNLDISDVEAEGLATVHDVEAFVEMKLKQGKKPRR